ncbi:DUF4383 domain-containing protein [Micromonospora echinofusca]|uniref:DUF4383 domain-containing protein n=1 Tax=Micromonospora echinofusca TaxID=47858 RepID=A0ABS3VN88_MICEH|nr:DUF4383 domain-containing protein [Micromonospora echinofusca]MBO4206003.1 DUF4383 domain-containing protein [Micromonospora echinofusca]
MAHNPVNHPARPIYRAIGGLTGGYLVVFGALGVIGTAGNDFFAQDDTLVLGQGANLAYSLVALVTGALIVLGTVLGRNIDVQINKILAYGYMVLSLAALAFLQTEANVLNFSVATVIVAMVIGMVLLMAAMYGKVGSEEEQKAWHEARLLL